MTLIAQVPTSQPLQVAAGTPFGLTVAFNLIGPGGPLDAGELTDPVVVVTWQGQIQAACTPTVTLTGSQMEVAWSAAQTTALGELGTASWALLADLSGSGPYSLVGGTLVATPLTTPGGATPTSPLDLTVDVGTVTVDLAITVGVTGGAVDSITAADGTITVGGTATEPTIRVAPDTFDAFGASAAEAERAQQAEALNAAAITAEAERAQTAEAGLIPLTEKGAADGVATLDVSGQVPADQLPALTKAEVVATGLAAADVGADVAGAAAAEATRAEGVEATKFDTAGTGLTKAGTTVKRAPSTTGYANKAALPAAIAANAGLFIRTNDGGVYESDGAAWQVVRDPSGTYASLDGGGHVPIDNLLPSDLRRVLNAVAPLTGDLAVGLLANGVDYFLAYGLGGGRYIDYILRQETTNPGAYALNQLQAVFEAMPMVSTLVTDASVVLANSWTAGSNDSAYGGGYRFATAANQTATITTPACNRMGLRLFQSSNGGLARVSIDGDFTKANLLPTAQQVVTAGAYPNTILVANGGPCNPTDRVLDCHASATTPDVPVAIADDSSIATAAHTVVLTPVAVARSVGAGTRVYLSGYSVATTGATTPTTANAVMHSSANLNTNIGSAWEYAFQTGGTFFGNVHGYDQQTGLTISVDGVTSALAAGQIVQAQSSVVVTRTSNLLNPANTAQVLALSSTAYRLDRNGLKVTPTVTWQQPVTLTAAYAMLPMNGVGAQTGGAPSQADVALSQGSILNYGGGPLTFTGSGDTYNGKVQASAAWTYGTSEATGAGYCAVLWFSNVNALVNGWVQSSPNYVAIEDRASFRLSKIYFGRIWTGGSENVAAGQVFTWDAHYLIGRLSSGVSAVAA